MDRNINKIILYTLSLLIISCAIKHENKLPSTVSLEGQQIFKEVYGSIYMKEVDSLIVISTIQEDALYKVYNKNEEFVSQFGSIGNGPNEFANPIHIYEANNKILSAYESNLLRLNKIDLIGSIEKGKLIISESYELPRELSGVRDVFLTNSNFLVGVYDDHFSKTLNEERGVFYYDLNNETYELIALENYKIEPNNIMAATNINAKMPAISPDRSGMAIVNVYSPLVEILDIEKKSIQKINLQGGTYKKEFLLENYEEGSLKQYYKFVHASNQYIYLLYSGKEEQVSDTDLAIQVISWKGEPVSQYTIPAKYKLSSFFVDESARIIYGQSLENDAMYRFKF